LKHNAVSIASRPVASTAMEVFIDFGLNCKEPEGKSNITKINFLGDIKEALKYMMGEQKIMGIFIIFVFLNFFISLSVSVPLPFIVNEVLRLNSRQFGMIQGAFSVGAIIGAFLVKKMSKGIRHNSYYILMSNLVSISIIMVGLPLLFPKLNVSASIYFLFYCLIMILLGTVISLIDIPFLFIMQINIPDPTGEGMLIGIKDELKDLSHKLPITISTEKNMKTCQTGLGITIVGLVKKESLRINKTKAGDKLYCVGVPKVGNEISLDDPEIANCLLIKRLLDIPAIHDIIPVGSKGIKGETEMLVSFLGLELEWNKNLPIDIQKTAGPATCVLVTCPTELEVSMPQPIFLLAQLK
jgi:hypothetical protein